MWAPEQAPDASSNYTKLLENYRRVNNNNNNNKNKNRDVCLMLCLQSCEYSPNYNVYVRLLKYLPYKVRFVYLILSRFYASFSLVGILPANHSSFYYRQNWQKIK